MGLFTKCYEYERAKIAIREGFYPYFHEIEENYGAEVVIGGKRVIMTGSNNYLGLSIHPKVKEAAIQAIQKYGTTCSGSRYLNGTLTIHTELEEKLADFMGKEAALVFSTGFQTNQGTIAPLVGRNEIIYCDRENHASIFDACRLSFGTTRKFTHNDTAHLEKLVSSDPPDVGKLIVVDGVFSMSGDVADLPEIVRIAKGHNARLMVDDAHGVGVMGRTARGTAEHFGLNDEVDIIMGTFSKSFASLGGFIVSEADVPLYKAPLPCSDILCFYASCGGRSRHSGARYHQGRARKGARSPQERGEDAERLQSSRLQNKGEPHTHRPRLHRRGDGYIPLLQEAP